MSHTAKEWNERYRSVRDPGRAGVDVTRDREGVNALQDAPPEPAEILVECVPLLPMGPTLDLACGTGRNTLFLAARRQSVTAVDYSSVALERLAQQAQAAGHPVERSGTLAPPDGPRGTIRIVEADLERARLPVACFDLILCFQYLQCSLFRAIEKTLQPGGFLLFETYTRAQQNFPGGPRNPEYLLAPGELRAAFPSLEMVFYRELQAGKGIATLLARKPGL